MNLVYAITTAIVFLLVFFIFLTPFLAFDSNPAAGFLYKDVFAYTCHQKISRSQCVFHNPANGYFIADCMPQSGVYVEDLKSQLSAINAQGFLGYKFPVCARDVGIYFAMLLGLLSYPFFRKTESKEPPPGIYLLLALVPLGIDGTLQLVSNIGIPIPIIGAYESTNFMRLATGAIAGFVAAFYIVPMLNYFFKESKKVKKSG
jgi:uncharacterized membrane protein